MRHHPARQAGSERPDVYAVIDSLADAESHVRRLKAEGATYEQVLDGLRSRLAMRLLRDQGLTVKEAAFRLGFSDPAAFSRAFKRWTGSSPRKARA